MKVETTVEISKPPSEVFSFLMDEENLSLWIKDFMKLERLQGEDGVVGSTSRHVYKENGRVTAFIEEILAVEEAKFFQSVLRNEQLEIEITNRLNSIEGEGTRLNVCSNIQAKTLWQKFRTFFSRKQLFKKQNEDILRLKEVIEALGEDFE